MNDLYDIKAVYEILPFSKWSILYIFLVVSFVVTYFIIRYRLLNKKFNEPIEEVKKVIKFDDYIRELDMILTTSDGLEYELFYSKLNGIIKGFLTDNGYGFINNMTFDELHNIDENDIDFKQELITLFNKTYFKEFNNNATDSKIERKNNIENAKNLICDFAEKWNSDK